MPPKERRAARPTNQVGASVAGASGGTGVLALVGSLPDTNHWKPILTFAAPTLAIVISAIWVFAMKRLDIWLVDRNLCSELGKAEKALVEIESDAATSEAIKREARSKVEALKMLRLTLHANRAQAIVEA